MQKALNIIQQIIFKSSIQNTTYILQNTAEYKNASNIENTETYYNKIVQS